MNRLPADHPRSMINQACGCTAELSEEETLNAGVGCRVANSGCCNPPDGAFWPLGSAIAPPRTGGLGRTFGFKGAPHSSQYCEPSRFSVLHLSQLIMKVSVLTLTLLAANFFCEPHGPCQKAILARKQRTRQSFQAGPNRRTNNAASPRGDSRALGPFVSSRLQVVLANFRVSAGHY